MGGGRVGGHDDEEFEHRSGREGDQERGGAGCGRHAEGYEEGGLPGYLGGGMGSVEQEQEHIHTDGGEVKVGADTKTCEREGGRKLRVTYAQTGTRNVVSGSDEAEDTGT